MELALTLTTFSWPLTHVTLATLSSLAAKKRSFRLTNVGKLPINFTLDKKLLNQAGISFDQDKAVKIMPNNSQLFTVVFTSRKQ